MKLQDLAETAQFAVTVCRRKNGSKHVCSQKWKHEPIGLPQNPTGICPLAAKMAPKVHIDLIPGKSHSGVGAQPGM